MSSIESTSANQPSKKGLNPIIKAMNDYRNNVIGEKIGSKAPKKTAPVFKVTLEAARLDLGIEEGVKNTIAIVDKASELFTANPDKFLDKETKTKKSSKKLTKEEDNNSEEEVKQVKKKSPKKPVQKKASPKKQVIESDTESDSESD